MPQTQDKLMLRLPDGLREKIRAAAKASRRSMNAEVIFHLLQALESPNTSRSIGAGHHPDH
ncbi:Arc family DNA-binding protein [Xanthobacter autotrophicus]|uniref:Arc family DNA-binding protein n=1 Tax=Xanthobacter autotrophicus TaxID=280 RepID=UPI00372A9AF8